MTLLEKINSNLILYSFCFYFQICFADMYNTYKWRHSSISVFQTLSYTICCKYILLVFLGFENVFKSWPNKLNAHTHPPTHIHAHTHTQGKRGERQSVCVCVSMNSGVLFIRYRYKRQVSQFFYCLLTDLSLAEASKNIIIKNFAFLELSYPVWCWVSN